MNSPKESGATAPSKLPPFLQAAFSPEVWEGLRERVLSALLLAVIFLGAEVIGGPLFNGLVLLVALQMIREWDALTVHDKLRWRIGGMFYVAIPALSLIWLRSVQFEGSPNAGMGIVLYLFLVVWATDIGAYFVGRAIGGPKLAPNISPSKTWAGLFGGMASAAIVGMLCAIFTPYPPTVGSCITVAIILAVVSQMGDLFESWLKRRAGVKDSGTLIPGHGGVLDRLDGLAAATPILALFVALSGMYV